MTSANCLDYFLKILEEEKEEKLKKLKEVESQLNTEKKIK